MNSTRSRTTLQSMKAPLKHDKGNVGLPNKRIMEAQKATTNRLGSIRERKKALQQDVDKLKIKLRHEENVHRALERAFTRPLGALPRLPPYLPPHTLELLAEVAVLEEEVVRLEDQVVHFRQGLYQEAVYISSSKRNMDNSCEPCDHSPINIRRQKQTKLAPQDEEIPILNDTGVGKENNECSNPPNDKQKSPGVTRQTVRTPSKKSPSEYKSPEKLLDPRKIAAINQESKIKTPVKGTERSSGGDGPNVISENILKCLSNIFIRMSSKRSKNIASPLISLSTLNYSEKNMEGVEFKDPYGICSEFGKRDIGPYKNLFSVEATSINPNQAKVSVFLVRRLKLLLEKLASVDLTGLNHQEKLAFWINIYNTCMMNAYLEHGVPESPELVVALMQKASINVGGHLVNAITIEHFILRLPYHSKFTFAKGSKNEETSARSIFGLELSEPLVTFALSCGSWSSPAVRIYTASGVENELEVAKKEYLQAAIGISTTKKVVVIPKLIDWYMLDFAKDLESLVDWICLELPNELGKEAISCLERGKDEPLSHFLEIMPYDFNFRYLLHT